MAFLDKLNTPAAREVFRQHHITATGLDGVRQGHAAKGDKFMYDMLKAISPKSSVLNGDFGGGDEMGPPTYDQWVTNQDTSSAGKTKRTWDDWLVMIGKTGETLSGVKDKLLGSSSTDVSTGDSGTPSSKVNPTIIYVFAGLIILTIGFLIYKQSKA